MLTKTYDEQLDYSAPEKKRSLICFHKRSGFAQMQRLLWARNTEAKSATKGETLIWLGESWLFTRVFWSQESSVVATSSEFGDDANTQTTLFTRAYDFRVRQQFKEEAHGAPFIEMSKHIEQLLQERGGAVEVAAQQHNISFRHQHKWRAIDPTNTQ